MGGVCEDVGSVGVDAGGGVIEAAHLVLEVRCDRTGCEYAEMRLKLCLAAISSSHWMNVDGC